MPFTAIYIFRYSSLDNRLPIVPHFLFHLSLFFVCQEDIIETTQNPANISIIRHTEFHFFHKDRAPFFPEWKLIFERELMVSCIRSTLIQLWHQARELLDHDNGLFSMDVREANNLRGLYLAVLRLDSIEYKKFTLAMIFLVYITLPVYFFTELFVYVVIDG